MNTIHATLRTSIRPPQAAGAGIRPCTSLCRAGYILHGLGFAVHGNGFHLVSGQIQLAKIDLAKVRVFVGLKVEDFVLEVSECSELRGLVGQDFAFRRSFHHHALHNAKSIDDVLTHIERLVSVFRLLGEIGGYSPGG